MRLTLRTLLAYLDDTLDPAETKRIGQKVAESTQAQELIARIKEVVRRRRLTTPPTAGPQAKIDPNTIAEYIDNVLAPDQLEEVEKVCLDSDVYLAEVAACHQILTVVLSEPALVPPTAKKRMYALVKGREAIPYRRATPVGVPDEAGEGEGEGYREEDETLLLGLPLLLRKGSWLRRAAPVAGVLVLVAALAFAIWEVIPHEGARQPRRPSERVAANTGTPDRKGQVPAPDTTGKSDQKTEQENKAAAETKPDAKAGAQAEAKPANQGEVKPDAKGETKPDAKAETTPATTTPATATPAAGGRREAGRYVADAKGPPSFLLARAPDQEAWKAVAPDSNVSTGGRLLSLPGFRNEILLGDGVQLSVWGSPPERAGMFTLESEVELGNDPAFDLDLRLYRGRVAITNNKPQGEAKVRVRVQDEAWILTLLEPQTVAAVETYGAIPPGTPFSKEKPPEDLVLGAGLFLLKGQANLKIRYDTYLMGELPDKNLFHWDNTGRASTGPGALPEEQLPSWARKKPPALPREMTAALEAFQKRLAGGNVEEAIRETLRDRAKDKAQARALAVFSMGALNDLPGLLEAQANEQSRDVRGNAIYALHHWIGLAQENDLKLYRALEQKYKSEASEIIMQLLHGFTPDDLSRPDTYEVLIGYLRHDKVAVRELAYMHLSAVAPDAAKQIAYDPTGPVVQRDAAVRKWQELVTSGKLPPPAARGAAPPGRNQ